MKILKTWLVKVTYLAILAITTVNLLSANESTITSIVHLNDFKKTSFAPSRGELFIIPVTLDKRDKVKQINIEIRSSDNDIIRILPIQFDSGKNKYEIPWDGKDSEGDIVPDEAYYPVLVVKTTTNEEQRIDTRITSGGEEVYDFEKSVAPGRVEYTLPVNTRLLIRAGIKNGPMLRALVDWEPRTAGFHVERWDGWDVDKVIAIDQNPKVRYLIIGYQLPVHSIITFANEKESYRAYRERKKLPIQKPEYTKRILERNGKTIRTEFYTPVLQQKSPRICVAMLNTKNRQEKTTLSGYEEVITEVKLNPLDEIYLDQERYEISFFVDNEFIAEEEQGFVPLTWRWSPGRFGIKPGKHILTVNVSGYNGQVGVKNMAFTLKEATNTK